MSYPELQYQVASQSTGEIYYISITRNGDNLTATCTCPAGEKKMHCKHRVAILQGDFGDVESGDTDQEVAIQEMLKGSDVEAAWNELNELEEEQKALKNRMSAAKKRFGQALAD